jgi:hypothetical protein
LNKKLISVDGKLGLSAIPFIPKIDKIDIETGQPS